MQQIGVLTVLGHRVRVMTGRYPQGQRPFVHLVCEDGEDFGTLSVNLPRAPLAPGAFHVKTWSENEPLAQAARDSGLFVDTGVREPTGFVLAEVWTFANPAHCPPGEACIQAT